jgi:hypothetical protein
MDTRKLFFASMLVGLGAASAAGAQEPRDVPAQVADEYDLALSSMSDEEIAARTSFIEERLRRNSRHALAWQASWTAIYAGGMVVQTGRAVVAESTSERADLIVSASKATIGTLSRVLRPPRAVLGARPLARVAGDSREERVNRLLMAEALARYDARQADNRYSWIAHTVNIGLNVAGALIVHLAFHDPERAWTSAAIGIAVGELQIWTQPWQPKRAWEAYQRSYGTPASSIARRSYRNVAQPKVDLGNGLAVSF